MDQKGAVFFNFIYGTYLVLLTKSNTDKIYKCENLKEVGISHRGGNICWQH